MSCEWEMDYAKGMKLVGEITPRRVSYNDREETIVEVDESTIKIVVDFGYLGEVEHFPSKEYLERAKQLLIDDYTNCCFVEFTSTASAIYGRR